MDYLAEEYSYDQFKWNVYSEMLEILDEELSTSGYQSRYIRVEKKDLLIFSAVDSTDSFPFLNMYIDMTQDGQTLEGTTVHELSHHALRHFSESYGFLNRRHTEKDAQLFEEFYLNQTEYLNSLGIQDALHEEMKDSNQHRLEHQDADLDEVIGLINQ